MFLNPLLLIGVGAAALPLVIHLLSRSRFRTVEWGAMLFLEGGDPRQQQSSRISQWILLLVRTALIALLAVALARPVLSGEMAEPGKGQPIMAVVLLDCSGSMGFDENGHTRMVLARGAAKQVLGLHKGDRVSLLLMGAAQLQPAAERTPTTDLWDVSKRVESAEPGYGRASIADGLNAAADIAEAFPGRDHAGADAPRSTVNFYVVSDRQASTWKEVDSAFAATWRERLRRAGIASRLWVIPVGGADADNVAIESVTLLNPPAIVGQPAEAEVRLRNYGSVQWAALPLTVSVGPRVVYDQKISLTAGASATFRIPLGDARAFRTAGTQVISASVKTQGFTADDRLDTVIDVIDPIRVLVISGDEPNRPATDNTPGADFSGESDYLQLALAPFRTVKREGGDASTVDVATTDNWDGASATLGRRTSGQAPAPNVPEAKEARLTDYQVVVLANVERFTPRQVLAIEQFVWGGGGVLIAPGNLSRPEEYNASLYRGGEGILPAALAPPTAVDGSQQTTLSGFDRYHPCFQFLRGRPDAFLSAVIGRYFPTAPHSASARDLARYVAGDPFLIESAAGAVGKGRVLLMTTSLDGDWSTLPMSSFYLPFVQSAVRYLADTSARTGTLAPGEPIDVPLGAPGEGRGARVTLPDGSDRAAEILRPDATPIARFADTQQPGAYVLRVSEGTRRTKTVHFVVRGPQDESDLAVLDEARWDWLKRNMDAERLDPLEKPITAAAIAPPARRELWAWIVGGVLGLGILEMGLARRWSSSGSADAELADELDGPQAPN